MNGRVPSQSRHLASEPSGPEAELAEHVLQLTNKERMRAGLNPLVLSLKLGESAQWKASDMAERDYFDHADALNHNFVDRAREFGYANWRLLGENIAAGLASPKEVVDQWMASPGHRANILKAEYREIGVGHAFNSDSKYRTYWVQDFGVR